MPPGVAARLALGVVYASGIASPRGPGHRRSPANRGSAVTARLAGPIEIARVPTIRLVERDDRQVALRGRPALTDGRAMTGARQGMTVTPFPEGTRLLHIGPPKTGTTSLQAAFWAARDEAMAQGVRYAGTSRHSTRAVLAVTGRRTLDRQHAVPPISHWETLLARDRRGEEARVVLSSEGFSYAQPDKIERVVGDLDPTARYRSW